MGDMGGTGGDREGSRGDSEGVGDTEVTLGTGKTWGHWRCGGHEGTQRDIGDPGVGSTKGLGTLRWGQLKGWGH